LERDGERLLGRDGERQRFSATPFPPTAKTLVSIILNILIQIVK
jgi:hypothetical protein